MDFCTVCDSRIATVVGHVLSRRCTKCQKEYDIQPTDTLMWQQDFTKRNISEQHEALLQRAAFDIANPIERVSCPECKAPLTRYLVVGDEMIHIRVCKCGHRWPYAEEEKKEQAPSL